MENELQAKTVKIVVDGKERRGKRKGKGARRAANGSGLDWTGEMGLRIPHGRLVNTGW